MKRIISLILAIVICLSLSACGSKRLFEKSKEAYEKIYVAYSITEQFGDDIYTAWKIGIFDEDKVRKEGISYLSDQLNLTEAELIDGVIYSLGSLLNIETNKENLVADVWNVIYPWDKDDYRNVASTLLAMINKDTYSWYVLIVRNAYELSGKTEEAQMALDDAKLLMKELSEKHSDYEYYPNLKGFYTTASSYLDFCKSPEGTFQQATDTIKEYRDEARDYINDLSFIFED